MLVADVLVQRAAERDVDHLHAAAHRQHRAAPGRARDRRRRTRPRRARARCRTAPRPWPAARSAAGRHRRRRRARARRRVAPANRGAPARPDRAASINGIPPARRIARRYGCPMANAGLRCPSAFGGCARRSTRAAHPSPHSARSTSESPPPIRVRTWRVRVPRGAPSPAVRGIPPGATRSAASDSEAECSGAGTFGGVLQLVNPTTEEVIGRAGAGDRRPRSMSRSTAASARRCRRGRRSPRPIGRGCCGASPTSSPTTSRSSPSWRRRTWA